MEFVKFTAGTDDNDRRIDKVLRNFIKQTQLSSIYKYIRKNMIKVNDKKVSQDYHVKTGDIISIAEFIINQNQENQSNKKETPQSSNTKNNSKQKLEIILKTEDLLIINKPYNTLVHGANDSLDKQVLDFYKNENLSNKNKSLSFTPGPLHRLDKKTTGSIAFSFSINGARWFSENIKNHTIKKYYLSVLQGKLQKKEQWEDYIEKDENLIKQSFHTVKASTQKNEDNSLQKNAITIVEPVKYGKYNNTDITLVKIEIKTGRTHQIRAQASLHHHPLLGDTAYNGIKIKENQDFFLHAHTLEIPQNDLNIPTEISAQLPKEFSNFISLYF